MDLIERACRLLDTLPPSVSGCRGHDACFAAASALVQGYDFDEGTALALLRDRFNPRCQPPWSERELLHKVRQARLHPGPKGFGYLLSDADRKAGRGPGMAIAAPPVAPAPEPERLRKNAAFDSTALRAMQNDSYRPGPEWLMERSPVDPRDVGPEEFLDQVFEEGERALVFYTPYSQGDYGRICGSPGKTRALGQRPGQPAAPVDGLPRKGKLGAWFLPVPMDGRWHPNGGVDKQGNPTVSRRSGASVVVWRHLLLESDHASESEWLNLLCQLPLPISAMYTSGGRSIHALVRIEAASKSMFDAFRDRIAPLLAKLGADPKAMSGVRLTRLPGVDRLGTMDKDGRYVRFPQPRPQQLLFLNPSPPIQALKTMPRLRLLRDHDCTPCHG